MGISIYEHSNYKGKSTILEEGGHATISIGNDKISSAKIEPGFYAYFYKDTGFRGPKIVLFEGDYRYFSNWNDEVSSIKVFKQEAPEVFPLVKFFTDVNCKGTQQNLSGTSDTTQFNKPFFKNDSVSSVIVPEGISITLYEHENFKGKSLRLEAGTHNLTTYGFNDKVSSVTIQKPQLELVNITYTNQEEGENGSPIGISGTAIAKSDVTQSYEVKVEDELVKSISRSWSNATMVGIEVSTSASVGVESGPLTASVSNTITKKLENTFTIGEEETKSEATTFIQSVAVNIPPNHIGKATIMMTPKKYKVDAIYTFIEKQTNRKVQETVTILVDDYQDGEAIIETRPLTEEELKQKIS